MRKVHLFESNCGLNSCAYRCQCGFIAGNWEIERLEMIDYKTVTCKSCKNSARYKELKELDKTMSEIKTEAEIDFKEPLIPKGGYHVKLDGTDKLIQAKTKHPEFEKPLNSHYNQGSTPTIEKINEVLEHLEGKINNKQAAQIYNMLKYWDRSDHKGTPEKDLFKCADSIHNAITGEFING